MNSCIKAVILDFDGTITVKKGNLWQKIWARLGYDTGEGSYYRELLDDFKSKKLSHEKWCVLCCNAYKEKGFSLDIFNELIDEISLMKGLKEFFSALTDSGIEIHIVSGNIVYAINRSLGDNLKYVKEVRANNIVFDESGKIVEIVGTKYDHEGKAKYIEELCQKQNLQPENIIFVGNSTNDEWAYKSGAKTVCINPDMADISNTEKWNTIIYTDNLVDLLEIVNNQNK